MSATVVDACWRQVGVRGDRSCPELRRHLHCDSCPVSARAARALLDRPRLENEPGDEPPPMRAATAQSLVTDHSFLVFRLGVERFAIESALAVEVVATRRIQRLPHRHGRGLRGICNVRGQLWLCASLHLLLRVDEPARPDPARRRLVVVGREGHGWTFEADEVQDIHLLASSHLVEAPRIASGDPASCTRASFLLAADRVGVLDTGRLFQRLEETLS